MSTTTQDGDDRERTAQSSAGMGGRVLKWVAALVAAALPLLGACEGNGLGPDGSGNLRVQFQQTGDAASAAMASMTGSETGMQAANVPDDAVDALNVTLSGLEVHREGATSTNATSTDDGDGEWVALELAENGNATSTTSTDGVVLDLTELPDSGDGVTVAAGELEAGTYKNLRIFFDKAELVLADSVTLGNESFAPGTYEVFIPSGDNTGIKVPTAEFTVDSETGETVTVLSDTDASIQNINVTGRGLLMTPVLTAETDSENGGT